MMRIETERQGHVAVIRLDHPPLNALTQAIAADEARRTQQQRQVAWCVLIRRFRLALGGADLGVRLAQPCR